MRPWRDLSDVERFATRLAHVLRDLAWREAGQSSRQSDEFLLSWIQAAVVDAISDLESDPRGDA